MYLGAICCLGVLLSLMCAHARAGSDIGAKVALALIADKAFDFHKSPLVSLLEAELSQEPNLKLLERAEIDKILEEKELQLTFEAEQGEARRQLGTLLGAELLVFVEKLSSLEQAPIRLRTVETHTGIIVDDLFQTSSDPENDVKSLVASLRPVLRKVKVPVIERRYIGIMDIRNEEPGRALNRTATALTALLGHDLKASTEIIVLEREQLKYLMAERDLAGMDIQLRASTMVLEGGIRRDGKTQDLSVNLRLLSLADGKAEDLAITVPAEPITVIRRQLCEAVVSAMDAQLEFEKQGDLRAEAALFAQRAECLFSHRHLDKAISFAETAMALDQSLDLRNLVYDCYRYKWEDSYLPLIERLKGCRRANEVDLEIVEQIARWGTKSRPYRLSRIFGVNMHFNPAPSQYKECKLLSEIYDLCLTKYKFMHDVYVREGKNLSWLLSERIENAFRVVPTVEQYGKDVRSIIQEYDRLFKGPVSRRPSLGQQRTFYGNLAGQFNPSHYQHLKRWSPEDMRPLLEWITKHPDPSVQLIGCYGMMYQDGEAGIHAAKKLLDMMFFENARDITRCSLAEQSVLRLLELKRAKDYFTSVLTRLEKSNDPLPLVRNPIILNHFLSRKPRLAPQFAQRIVELVESAKAPSPIKCDPTPLLTVAERYLPAQSEPTPKARNPWSNYAIKPIPILNRNPQMHDRLVWVQVDKHSEELVLIWRSPVIQRRESRTWFDYIVTRTDIRGGEMCEVARLQNLEGLVLTCSEAGPGCIFLGTKDLGLVMVGPDGAQVFQEAEGIPANHVKAMAWLGNYLYLGFDGCLAKFDPDAKRFEIIASSRAVQKRNALDGGHYYKFHSMLADPNRYAVWISIREASDTRTGIWKYAPATAKLERTCKVLALHMTMNDAGNIFSADGGGQAYLLNPETGRVTYLRDYSRDADRAAYRYKGGVMIGKDVINVWGWLCSDDGKLYRLEEPLPRWQMLEHFGPGFIAAHYHDSSAKLWYIEPGKTQQIGHLSH